MRNAKIYMKFYNKKYPIRNETNFSQILEVCLYFIEGFWIGGLIEKKQVRKFLASREVSCELLVFGLCVPLFIDLIYY